MKQIDALVNGTGSDSKKFLKAIAEAEKLIKAFDKMQKEKKKQEAKPT